MRWGRVLSQPVARPQCPHLGLASDPFSHGPHASEQHRCYAQLGRERIDLAHQRRFCLAGAHAQCPFLIVSPNTRSDAWLERARAGWRSVSLSRPTLSAAQLGHPAELSAAVLAIAWAFMVVIVARIRWLCGILLQTWRSIRPTPQLASDTAPAVVQMEVSHMMHAEVDPVEVEVAQVDLPEVDESAWVADPLEVTPMAVEDEDLVNLGLAAIEAGLELEAHACFKRATEIDRLRVAAWFWRAKTAETLEEVIECLKHANRLDPDNAQIAANLRWATERLQANHAMEKLVRAAEKAAAKEARRTPHLQRPSVLARTINGLGNGVRLAAALVSFTLAAMWLVSGLPTQIRDNFLQASGMRDAPLPDVARLTSIVHIRLGDSYELATAIPFAIGFFALFLGAGLLNHERWTRLWVPTLALFSAWLIAG